MFKFPYEELTWERGIEFTVDRLKKKKNKKLIHSDTWEYIREWSSKCR